MILPGVGTKMSARTPGVPFPGAARTSEDASAHLDTCVDSAVRIDPVCLSGVTRGLPRKLDYGRCGGCDETVTGAWKRFQTALKSPRSLTTQESGVAPSSRQSGLEPGSHTKTAGDKPEDTDLINPPRQPQEASKGRRMSLRCFERRRPSVPKASAQDSPQPPRLRQLLGRTPLRHPCM